MKRLQVLMVGVGVLAALVAAVWTASLVAAQEQQATATGWLEGRMHYQDGKPAAPWCRVFSEGKEIKAVYPDKDMDGLYQFLDLKPGTYELRVPASYGHKAVRIWGVLVKPGERTILDVTLHEGQELEEIGEPVVVTQPAIVVSSELARLSMEDGRLSTELDALKKELATLKK